MNANNFGKRYVTTRARHERRTGKACLHHQLQAFADECLANTGATRPAMHLHAPPALAPSHRS